MPDRMHFLTPEGKKKLEEELEHLRTVRRPEITEHLRSAIEEGDITENAGYDETKREQAFVEGRIREIEAILRGAQIIAEDGSLGVEAVSLGSRVTILEEGGIAPETYHIVGPAEADPLKGRISYESPLGQALMGRRVGDTIPVDTPGGLLYFRIQEIN